MQNNTHNAFTQSSNHAPDANLFEQPELSEVHTRAGIAVVTNFVSRITACKVDDETRTFLRKRLMDNFVFRHSSVICSLEYEMLRSCFHSQLPQESKKEDSNSNNNYSNGSLTATPAAPQKPFNTCEKDAMRYGNCLYRRFDYAANIATCSLPCRYDYYAYKMCSAAVKNTMNAYYDLDRKVDKLLSSSSDDDDKSEKSEEVSYSEEKINCLHDERNNRADIEDYCYLFQRDMLTCTSRMLHIDYTDYARDDPQSNTALTPPI